MLLAETGLPLFVHTVRNVQRCTAITRVVVAADSDEVLDAARAHGIDACLTRVDHTSGTDRVFEAASALDGASYDVLVNVQGDEPELAAEDLELLVASFHDPAVESATLCAPFEDPSEAVAAQVVKVVRAASGDALYFSRSVVPYLAVANANAYARGDASPWLALVRRHIGVYAFRPAALADFVALPRGELERVENLEQLRWLEAGRRMRVVDARHVPLGIDTRLDYDAFVRRVASRAEARARLP